MTRKSKKSSGHTPLTYYEMNTKFKSSRYGTTTARLSTDSQLPFGYCTLSLSPAIDPVATPSGHIYSREAILEYMITKTAELKQARAKYEQYRASQERKRSVQAKEEKEQAIVVFESSQKASSANTAIVAAATSSKRSRGNDDDNDNDERKKKSKDGKSALARTSYWLAEYQPEHIKDIPEEPPERPSSPYSGRTPLLRKHLKSLILKRDGGDKNSSKVLCALSDKTISTQEAVALPSGNVILRSCYDELVKPTMVDPFTSKKIKKEEKYVLKLQKGRSGFAHSGPVEAKIYRPTMT